MNNNTCLSDVPATEPEGREFDSCPGNGNFLCPGRQIHWERWSRFYLPRGHPYLCPWNRTRRVTQPRVRNMIREELALVKQNGAWKPRRKKGWSGLFNPPNGLNFQFCWFNLIVLIAQSWSESNFILFLFFYSIRVDPTRTGGPSWSGPTFVPACLKVYLKGHVRMELKRQKAYLPLFSLPWCKLLFKHLPFAVVPSIAGDPHAYSAPPQKVECVWQLLADGYQTKHGHSLSSYKTLPW